MHLQVGDIYNSDNQGGLFSKVAGMVKLLHPSVYLFYLIKMREESCKFRIYYLSFYVILIKRVNISK